MPVPVVEGVESYFGLLRTWNRSINLTSLNIEQPADEALDRLLVEPVVAGLLAASLGARRLVDIGSGGGSPALPFRLSVPGAVMTLIESRHKKAVFLREAIRLLGLADTTVEARRLDEVAAAWEPERRVDVITVRAVRLDGPLFDSVEPMLKPDGRLFLFGTTHDEAQAVASGRFTLEDFRVLTPSSGSHLSILRLLS